MDYVVRKEKKKCREKGGKKKDGRILRFLSVCLSVCL